MASRGSSARFGMDLLNIALTFPLTFCLVLASRRVWPAIVLALLLPPATEFLQTQLPGRNCAVSDMVTNSLGALAGVAAGWAIELRSRYVR